VACASKRLIDFFSFGRRKGKGRMGRTEETEFRDFHREEQEKRSVSRRNSERFRDKEILRY
jgi:hypothetical protein